MHDDRMRALLLGIERRILIEDPALVRRFGAAPRPVAADHRRGTEMISRAAGLTLCATVWWGPRALTAAEVARRGSAAPRRAATAI